MTDRPRRPKRAAGSGPERVDARALVFVTVGGLLVRLGYVLQSAGVDPMFHDPQMDALFHHQWALAILRGGWLAEMPFFRAPLYPHFLSLVYRVLGVNLLYPRLAQAVLGGLTCGLVYLLALELFNRRAALAAAIAAAGYPLLIYFDGELLMPSLLVPLVLLGLLLLLKCRRWDRYWFLPGAAWGLAAITRPNVLAFVVLVPLWLWLDHRQGLWKRLLPFGLALAAVILPVTVRNRLVSGEFIPIAWQGGVNFYIGNNPSADGVTAVVPGTRKDWWGGYYDSRRLAEEAAGRKLGYSELDRYWFGRGLRFIARSPARAAVLLLRKAYLWWGGREISNNRDIGFFTRFTFLRFLVFQLPLLQFPFGLLVPLAGVGVLDLRRSWRRHLPIYLFIAGYSLSFIFFFVTARFRLPLVPLLLPFAAAGGQALYRAYRDRRGRLVSTVVLATLLVFLNAGLAGDVSINRAQTYSALADQRIRQGRTAEAEELLARARKADPGWSELHVLTGIIARQRGDLAGAESALRTAAALDSTRPDVLVYLGDIRMARGKVDSAQYYYELALRRDPYSAFANCRLGNVLYRKNELTRALDYYARASGLAPDYTVPLYNSGLVRFRQGDTAQAVRLWERVLEIAPRDTLALRRLQQLGRRLR